MHVIDVRRRDPWVVVRDIASCEKMVSASLYGVIIADGFRIPNVWLKRVISTWII